MKRFRLHWLTGKTEDVEGSDIADAFRRAGYGGGAPKALDYWEEIEEYHVTLEDVKMRLITEVGGRIFDEPIHSDEKFMADFIVAIRNGKSPADVLSFLADVGSDHLEDPKIQVGRANRIGPRS